MSVPILPGALRAPAPSWTRDVDVVVLGSGAGGLAAALAARPARSVLIVTKGTLDAGSTAWAQGGLAAVLDPHDTLEDHVRDTLDAGAGLCDEAVVRELVTEAPRAIRYLVELGAVFDPAAEGGGPALTREGGHSHNRIVHARGDQSGAEVQRTLDRATLAAGAEVLAHGFALDLLVGCDADGGRRVAGVRVGILGPEGAVVSVGDIQAPAVVLATGGFGQVFASTSNPPALTGDGLALALRAGLRARDVEFVQFHPTVFWRGPDARGQQPLISEAVRGEGAVLRDVEGRRIMPGVHPLEDMAPRDVVAAAISRRMAESTGPGRDHVMLDATHLGSRFAERFPTITAACLADGIDPATDWIPVAPAAHYSCGGVVADLDGRTALPGLYAVGEVACTGLHGANRLASNSLTESVVAGTRVGRGLAAALPPRVMPLPLPAAGELLVPADRAPLRAAMSRHVGVMRTPEGLAEARATVDGLTGDLSAVTPPCQDAWEATNLLTVAAALVAAASAREESRGCHRRTDWTDPRPEWAHHLDVRLTGDGLVVADSRPATVPVSAGA